MAQHSDLTIGQLVRQYRKDRGFSQDQLAEGICSRQTISFLENGQHFPSVEIMQKIADKLAIPMHEIMGNRERDLEAKIQFDIIKVYVEKADYKRALALIHPLYGNESLLEFQKRQLCLLHAECLMRTGETEKAVVLLLDLQRTLEQQKETDDLLLATFYNKMGSAFYLHGDMTNAYANYQRAFQVSQRIPPSKISAEIAFNLGLVCTHNKSNRAAIEYYSLAKNYFDEVSNLENLAQTLFNLALVYKDLDELDKTANYMQNALALFESLNHFKKAVQVRQQYAYYVTSELDQEQAIAELLDCAKEFESMGDVPRMAYSYARAAGILMKEEKLSEAGCYIDLALKSFAREMSYKQPLYAYVYQVYSKYLFLIKNYEQCIEFSLESADIFGKMGLFRDAVESLQSSVEAYRKQGLFQKASEILQRMVDLYREQQDLFSLKSGGSVT